MNHNLYQCIKSNKKNKKPHYYFFMIKSDKNFPTQNQIYITKNIVDKSTIASEAKGQDFIVSLIDFILS